MKNIFVAIIIFVSTFSILPSENELAKFYLNKAYSYYKSNRQDLTKQYLLKSYEYSKRYPEYYYIANKLLVDDKNHRAGKKDNVDKIIKNLNNSFLINHYELLKHSAEIYRRIRNFTKSAELYDKIVSIQNYGREEDYIDYIEVLFNLRSKHGRRAISMVIQKAKQIYGSLNFDYYLLYYNILYKTIDRNVFINKLNVLTSNNYSNTRILYLRVLFFNDSKKILKCFYEYLDLKDKKRIESGYRKKIIFELLKKSDYFSKDRIVKLLEEWNSVAQDNYKTLSLLKNKRIRGIVTANLKLNELYLKYTGVRVRDEDEDGDWEIYYEYKRGIVIEQINDENQDGIYEIKLIYEGKKKIKEYFIYENSNVNYRKFIFNSIDQSLLFIEHYKENSLCERITLSQSLYYPDRKILRKINKKTVLPYVVCIENWDPGYSKTNYFQTNSECKYVDANDNKIFEKKIFYKDNNLIDKILKDLNEDGNYEMYEKYENGKRKTILYKTEENLSEYDYKEELLADRLTKSWDYNCDGIFEFVIEELNSGVVYEKFDINYDGQYDYMYKIYDSTRELYRIDGKEVNFKKKELVKEYSDFGKLNKKNWNVISVKNLKYIKIPEEIFIENKRKLSGVYKYNNKKYYFKNAMIVNDSFSYRLFFINNVIYLFENY